ncbi:hypothetical protein V2J09_018917 [Rumex salicifolius]
MASAAILPIEDKDLDDADLWAVIDSAAASYSTAIATTTSHTAVCASKFRKPLTLNSSNCRTPQILHLSSPSPPQQLQKSSSKASRYNYNNSPNNSVNPYYGGGRGEVLDSFDRDHQRPQKVSRSSYRASEVNGSSPAVVRHVQMSSPVTPIYSSPGSGRFTGKEISPFSQNLIPIDHVRGADTETGRQIASGGRINSVNLFKEYQETAMAILEKSDYIMISGNPYIKKSGWRKMAFYFNVSFEIKDKTIEFDDKRNVQRAEFMVRAHMPSGRFSDGWGSCERTEKRFMKPNNDIPTTAETRAKNRACQVSLDYLFFYGSRLLIFLFFWLP